MVEREESVRINTVFPEEILLEFMMSCSQVEYNLHFDEEYDQIFFISHQISNSFHDEMRVVNQVSYTTIHLHKGRMRIVYPRLAPVLVSSRYQGLDGVFENTHNNDINVKIIDIIKRGAYILDAEMQASFFAS